LCDAHLHCAICEAHLLIINYFMFKGHFRLADDENVANYQRLVFAEETYMEMQKVSN